jgi:SAM-dependent methyltransferase
MTSRRLRESDLGALYSTYYPRKQVNVEGLKREAAHSVRPWARLLRWWAGTDNQGQYAVRPGELMLDIGCGSGLSLLEARSLGAEVRGIEADPNVRRIADELGLRIHIGSLLEEPFAGELFDLVVLNQVIEHVPDPVLTLDRLRSRLRRGGRIVLVFPNVESFWRRLSGNSWINWHVPYHLHHFSRGGFGRMAARLGYEVRSVRTITPNLWTILQIRANRSWVERGVPSPVWAVPAPPVQSQTLSPTMRRGVGRVLRGVARRVVLEALMIPIAMVNRLVDAMGWGDSVMVEIVPAEMP